MDHRRLPTFLNHALGLGRISQIAIHILLANRLLCCQVFAQEPIERAAARAEQFEREGRWKEAAAAYQQILRSNPDSVPALNRLGALYVRQGKYQEGLKYYLEALKLNPQEFGTNLNLGIAYFKMQDYRSALAPLENAVRADPSNSQPRQLLGAALIGQDDYLRAIPHLEKAAALDPRDTGVRSEEHTSELQSHSDLVCRLLLE